MSDKIPSTPIQTPRGVAVWPKLDEPDVKFKPEGEYTIKVRIPAKDAAALIAKIDPVVASAKAMRAKAFAEEKNPAKRQKISDAVHPGYTEVFDDNGNATGEFEFNFKMLASGISKKTQKPWSRKPALFDAKGKPVEGVLKVGGGSVVKVSGEASPFFKPAVGYGASLRLEAVQVIELRTYAQKTAKQFGFGEEEGGFAADDAPTTPFQDESATPASSGAADAGSNEDF